MDLASIVAHPVFQGALAGLVAAATVDYHAFMRFQSPSEAKQYAWGTAAFRWLQGTIGGAVTAAVAIPGLSWLVS